MAQYDVELINVIKEFPTPRQDGAVRAVDDVSLQINDGEFFALLGPSGCGKTTTLRMIAGFEDTSSGQILIRGKAVQDVPPFHRPVNTVFQDYALFPHMTALQNVMFGLEMEGVNKTEAKQRAKEALELVRLPQAADRKPRQLSGGQQQRVALARALVKRPAVLLLDEPLSALDLKLREAMRYELKAMQKSLGITFIFVTHDQEEAMTMADRIAVMDKRQGAASRYAGRNLRNARPPNSWRISSAKPISSKARWSRREGKCGVVKLDESTSIRAIPSNARYCNRPGSDGCHPPGKTQSVPGQRCHEISRQHQ